MDYLGWSNSTKMRLAVRKPQRKICEGLLAPKSIEGTVEDCFRLRRANRFLQIL